MHKTKLYFRLLLFECIDKNTIENVLNKAKEEKKCIISTCRIIFKSNT